MPQKLVPVALATMVAFSAVAPLYAAASPSPGSNPR